MRDVKYNTTKLVVSQIMQYLKGSYQSCCRKNFQSGGRGIGDSICGKADIFVEQWEQ